MNTPVLGIMVCRLKNNLFYEKGYYRFLQYYGNSKNILVFVFYPDRVNWKTNRVQGFQYDPAIKKWVMKWFPLPQYVYDRCFYSSAKTYSMYKPYVERLKQHTGITFLGVGLKGKWDVYQILSIDSNFQNYLPTTEIYTNSQQLFNWLDKFPVILKPLGGSHGAGVVKITSQNNRYHIIGRNLRNQMIEKSFDHKSQFLTWVRSFIHGRKFIIQQFIDLTTSDHQPYDIRVFLQKNSKDQWETLGKVARIGSGLSVTSNLHGGGQVEDTVTLLEREFGKTKASEILNKIDHLATTLPSHIEARHGRLFELGLDVGIDRQGNVWIIEVNSKPGRKVFALLGDKKKRYQALINPILYSQYLAKKTGGKAV